MSKNNQKNKKQIPLSTDALFVNHTTIETKVLSQFQNHISKKRVWTFAALICLVFAGAGVGLAFFNTYVGVSVFIAGIIGGAVVYPYLSRETVRRQNLDALGENYTLCLNAYEKNIVLSNEIPLTSDDENSSTETQEIENKQDDGNKLLYSLIYKVDFYKSFAFIYLGARQSIVIASNGMKKGKYLEFANFLKGKGVQVYDKTSLPEPADKCKEKEPITKK